MEGGTSGKSGGGGGPEASMDPLLREHADLREALVRELRRLGEPGLPAEAVLGAEARAAELLEGVLADLGGIVAEAMRRGVGQADAEAAYDRVVGRPDGPAGPGGPGGLDMAPLFDAALPEAPDGPSTAALRRRAESGSAPARYLLAQAGLHRARSADDFRAALELLERAADQGHGPSAYEVASLSFGGRGVRKDVKRGLALLRRAADAGVPEACWNLARLHAAGDGVPRDPEAALRLLKRAAASGHVEAQLELGLARAVGALGAPIDHGEALRWLSKAAARHRAPAREWMETYGAMAPAAYRSRIWLESWTPTELPPGARSGWLGQAMSLGLLALLLFGAARGNSLGAFLLVVFVAILLHEAGHLVAARRAGIPVLVFSIGVGPLVRSFHARRGRLPMRVDLRLLPLMGSVQPYVAPRGVWEHWQSQARAAAAGEEPPPLPEFDTEEEPGPVFLHVSRPRRLLFLLGGLAVNLLAAVACLWAYETWSPAARLVTAPVAGPVPAGSVAAEAGLREGDRFLTVDGVRVRGFHDVRRRLAPVGPPGAAAPLRDPPGTRVPLVVRRGEAEVGLEWTTPAAPPGGDAREAYGLVPPTTWRVARVLGGAVRDVRPGDGIEGFEADGRMVGTSEPGAALLFRARFAGGAGGTVRLLVRRADGAAAEGAAGPLWEGGKGRPPFEFETVRETGPPRGLGEVLGRIGRFGWESVVGLPREILSSLRSPPTREEQGALLAAVREDPWTLLRLFAFVHAFLLFLNLVPVPPLDGFQILCCLLEMAARRPLPRRGVSVAMRAGWVVLGGWLLLNAFLILRDLATSVI